MRALRSSLDPSSAGIFWGTAGPGWALKASNLVDVSLMGWMVNSFSPCVERGQRIWSPETDAWLGDESQRSWLGRTSSLFCLVSLSAIVKIGYCSCSKFGAALVFVQ